MKSPAILLLIVEGPLLSQSQIKKITTDSEGQSHAERCVCSWLSQDAGIVLVHGSWNFPIK